MSIAELLIMSVALAMDAFAVSVCKGLSLKNVTPKHMLICGIWFGLFQALMPLLGYGAGRAFRVFIDRYSHWVAFGLLLIVGVVMIRDAFKEEEEVDASLNVKTMLMLAIATSIDAFAVGASLALLNVNIFFSTACIGVITLGLSAAGVKIGSLFGTRYHRPSLFAGGVVLCLIGLKILLTGLGVL